MWVLPYANHHFTVMLSGLWVLSSPPRSKAAQGQLTDRSCYEKRAGSGGSPPCLLGAAVKLRPWALAWTALQLCCHHIDAWACTLLIQTLTQAFRLNIPAWSQAFLIIMGLLSGLDSQLNLAKFTRSALLALLRCSGTGSLSVRLPPLPALLPSSASGSLSIREQTAFAVPWQILSEPFFIQIFSPAEIALGFYHLRDKYIQTALASFIIVLNYFISMLCINLTFYDRSRFWLCNHTIRFFLIFSLLAFFQEIWRL